MSKSIPTTISDAEESLTKAAEALRVMHLCELKSMPRPSQAVKDVVYAATLLLSDPEHKTKKTWINIKRKTLKNQIQFLKDLRGLKCLIDRHELSDSRVNRARKIVDTKWFQSEIIKTKSSALEPLSTFLKNVIYYYDIKNSRVLSPCETEIEVIKTADLKATSSECDNTLPAKALPLPPHITDLGKFYNISHPWPPISTNLAALPLPLPLSSNIKAAGVPLPRGESSVAECLSNWT